MDFRDRDAPCPSLEIMENKQHSRAKVLTLKVHPPVIGAFPLVRKMMDTSHHLPEWSSIETNDSSTYQNVVVIPPRRDENISSWRVPSSGFGEVRYTSCYWEWVEDVLAPCNETLDNIKTYNVIFASMFTYDHNENMINGSLFSQEVALTCFRCSTDLPKVPSTKFPFENGQSSGLEDIPSNVYVFEECITSPNSLYVEKSSHLPLAEVKSQAANEIQLTKLMVPYSEKVETSQNNSTTNVEVGAHQIGCSDVSKDSVLLEDFFKKHGYFDVARLSTSQKITRDSHQELLSAAQQCLETTNEEKVNMEKQLEELQKVLTRSEKDLKAWTSKKKKTISLIEDHQKRLYENDETSTKCEDEIHAIEKIIPLSET
ncbi:hypothetical protein H5410_028013 [Solanum commersonii]|uniref:Uncharacterized protein n=1 Tax=Solanum commersonii TaxID=4109 RepID=A0A9J5Z0U2_SOLCO|nr:hypothetical protein H5410_028013 [Solanum commersonii]